MLRYFESRIDPVALPPAGGPPAGLLAFYWYFIAQAKGLFAALFVVGMVAALLETAIPYFIGRLMAILTEVPREQLLATAWPTFAMMLFVVLVARPLVMFLQRAISNHGISAGLNTLTRWQSHHHVIRQSLGFFQNDFAGRIANHVMQAGSAVRETALALMRSVLHILFYGVAATGLMMAQDWRLALPIFAWFCLYVALLAAMVPRMRERARYASAKRSAVTGKVVDSYTNILTVKLFARTSDEDRYVRDSMIEQHDAFLKQHRLNTLFTVLLNGLNAVLLAAIGSLSVMLWQQGTVEVAAVAMVLPLTIQIISMSGWVAAEIQGIFENVGTVQESMGSIARPQTMQDEPGALPLTVTGGAIRFDAVRFGYGRSDRMVVDDFSLTIRAGEKVGLVGRSGAGKSTLVSLLLRFHDVEGGAISIDGQDVRAVTQESLRQAISVVTQDTSLLHRSIRDNILYGRREASDEMVKAAAEKAQAAAFIPGLQDIAGRNGYDAHVGERGVKLSGGQRQRIAIARVILKDAPILVLDEATAALDSEVEAAIQDSLGDLMAGKTVIAIAHRLSTLKIMDRLVVLDEGRIVEEGTHDQLIASGGLYAELWARQSGGFIVSPKGMPLNQQAAE
ncbi:ABC transporter ATP-binding protein [Phreatobacter aquaticus]|uniref:ABC transporter ATP-binding protein n=1 Tax=Phreatobacter aquaticus TaxID=2570229 RepID=A0A4D7QBA5_9HYPH|nr:ABC transporter ATP-binding protein [Phreatobacter aquaticus]QCK84458.1 ABC transporter ATP-binding protein [Phreatobacter aquaticus]